MWNTYIWKPVSTMWLKKDNCDFLSHNSDIFLAIQTFSFAILRYKLRIVRQSLELWDVNSEMWDEKLQLPFLCFYYVAETAFLT